MSKLTVDVFQEIVHLGISDNPDAKKRVEVVLADEFVIEALAEIKNPAVNNLAIAAFVLAPEVKRNDVQWTIENAVFSNSLGWPFLQLAKGYTPEELVAQEEYARGEIDSLVSALTAAGIFDAGQNDLRPDVVDLLSDVLRYQPPTTLTNRRRKWLWPE